MARSLGLEFASQTDTGLVRSHNEDFIELSPAYGFAILADGMGGYNAGEVASRIAAGVLKKALEEGLEQLRKETYTQLGNRIHQLLARSILQTNTAILEAAHAEPRYAGMGTTLVAALFHDDQISIAHVGDSRAYRLRHDELVQLTRDHSLLQEQLDAGLISPEWAQFSPNKNLVTRALGVGFDVEAEVHEHYVEDGDIYLLCSDGLSDMLSGDEIRSILTDNRSGLTDACETLIRRANDNGGHDNISAILVAVRAGEMETQGLFGRVLRWMT